MCREAGGRGGGSGRVEEAQVGSTKVTGRMSEMDPEPDHELR